MGETQSDRRKAENEVFFRQSNERTEKSLRVLKEMATDEDQMDLVPDLDRPIHFYCECSDENCRQRIKMKPSIYRRLHKNADQFVIVPGHIDSSIEREIKTTETYSVVEKFVTTPSRADHLNPTDVNNS